jgi:hypothetical protein
MTRLDACVQHSPYYFFVVPRDAAFLQILFTALREPHDASHARVTCPCRACGGCEMVVHHGSAKQRVPVPEPHRIPLEHTERTLLILSRVISIEESVPETRLFGLPSFQLTRRPRLRALLSTPFNARCDRSGLICHGSPPLLDRTRADGAARLPRRPLISGTPSVTSHKGCQGINTACPVPGVLYVPISCRGSMPRPGDDDWILEKGRVGEYVGLRIQPRQPLPLDRIGD